MDPDQYVTPVPWHLSYQHPWYGTEETYRRAAAWLIDCEAIADWGGGSGHFGRFLNPNVNYVVIDGTLQGGPQVLADLASYHEPCEGIMLRHVLDMTEDWRNVLANALRSFQRRMVVITFSAEADRTHVTRIKGGWPMTRFALTELRAAMAPHLVRDEQIRTSHPERIYYLERAS